MAKRRKLTKGHVFWLLDESECEYWNEDNSTSDSNENRTDYVSEVSDEDILDGGFSDSGIDEQYILKDKKE